MISRFINFLKIFRRSKKGMIGLGIITAFCIVAVAAPWITPYTDLGEDPNREFLPLADVMSAPTWLRYLPKWLGGKPDLTETISVIQKPGCPKLYPDGELFATGDLEKVKIFASSQNFPGSSEGSLAVSFHRKPGEGSAVTVVIYKQIYFPFTGPPGRFTGTIMLLVNGTTREKEDRLDIPLNITLFIASSEGKEWKVFPPPGKELIGSTWLPMPIPSGFSHGPGKTVIIDKPLSGPFEGWISTVGVSENKTYSYFIDSQSHYMERIRRIDYEILAGKMTNIIFSKNPGNYTFGVRITFMNTTNLAEESQTTVYIDEFGFILWGNAFGLLGTDHRGRDLFSQLVYGTRVSLYVGLLVAVLSVVIGLTVGLFSGYKGGIIDEVVMRFNDFLMVIPGLPLLMVLVVIFGTSVEILILLLGLLGWMGFARLVRSQTLSLKERPFIEAVKAVGGGTGYIILRHLIPNVMPLVYVSLATSVPGAVLAEASLSWLGFFDPKRMSWGRMLYNFTSYAGAKTNWWWILPPGLSIALLAVSFIMLGYALDEVLNPRLRIRR